MIPNGLLPAGALWCVAGGWAACPALATDMDVWVYGAPTIDLSLRRAALLAHLEQWAATNNTKRPIWPEKRYRVSPQETSETFLAYEGLDCAIEKVAVITLPRTAQAKPIHLMVTDAPDPGTLLQGFDVSTHAVAIDHTGRIFRHPQWTAPHQTPIEILHNEHTPDRMARIAARFGHTLEAQTIGY